MNLPATSSQPAPQIAASNDDDSIHLLELLDVVLDHKWWIAAATAATLAIGATYAVVATPIYDANTLIQVEDAKGNPLGNLMGEAGTLFDIKTPATAEIEILRSRLVIGQAVRNLQLQLQVRPKYVPIFGRWLARKAEKPSTPGFLGMRGYVRGNEALQVVSFTPPADGLGDRFVVELTPQGYALLSPDGEKLGEAAFGAPMEFAWEGNAGQLEVASAIGLPGAQFYLVARSMLAVTEELQKQLKITEQGKQSGVLRANLEGADPQRITAILNEVGGLYVRQNVERKAAEAEKTINFLNTQLPQLKQELETNEKKFNQFRTARGTFDLDEEAKTLLNQGVSLKIKLLEAQQKRQELLGRFTEEHASVQVLTKQIASLSDQINSLERKAQSFPLVQQDMLSLTRNVKVSNELYTNLLNSLQQLRLIKEGKVGNVRIVDVAAIPERPVKPQKTLVLALAGVLGLLFGLGLAFVRNSLRHGIRHADELEHELGLHVFATVPLSDVQTQIASAIAAKQPGLHVLAHVKPDEPAIESLRSLRTALQFAMLDAANNIVLVTGPTPGIGKSFTSTNFAAVLAAANQRILLVDAGLRRGHLHQFLGLQRGLGLSELIAGSAKLEDVLHKGVLPNMDFISTGTMPPNPAELLMSASKSTLWQKLSAQYDIVLVDSPPVLAVADTTVLAPQAGTVFMVARAEVTNLGEMQESIKRLAQGGVAVKGAIFNGFNIDRRRYGYGYGYKYKKYGYRYQSYKYTSQSSS